jgi:hypothetical protein
VNPILTALSHGYTHSQILNYMSSAFPELAPSIKQAVKYGYSTSKIVNYLGSLFGGGEEIKGGTEAAQEKLSGEQAKEKFKQLGGLGIGALGAYATSKAVPSLIQGAKGLFGQGGQPNTSPAGAPPAMPTPQPAIGPQPMGNAPVSPAPIPPVGPAPAGTTPSVPNVPNVPSNQPTQQTNPPQSVKILEEMGLGGKIKNLSSAGNPPESIFAAVNVSLTPGQKKWLDEKIKSGEAKPMEQMITDYVSSQGSQPSIQPSQNDLLPTQENLQPQKEMLKPVKGDLVFDEETGLAGELKDIKQKEALIDDNGKLHKVKVSDLERTPEELIEAAKDLLKIPEVDRSSVISLVTYRPSTKQMFIQYHNGETYAYEDIPDELVTEIADAMGTPVTSGKNLYGAWEEGKQDSRGAALIHKVIRDPRYSKDNEGKTWEKLGTPYNYWKKLRKPAKRKSR